jgi:hypothetical protein
LNPVTSRQEKSHAFESEGEPIRVWEPEVGVNGWRNGSDIHSLWYETSRVERFGYDEEPNSIDHLLYISAHGENPYRKENKRPFGLFHSRKSPYGPAAWALTLNRYRAGLLNGFLNFLVYVLPYIWKSHL